MKSYESLEKTISMTSLAIYDRSGIPTLGQLECRCMPWPSLTRQMHDIVGWAWV